MFVRNKSIIKTLLTAFWVHLYITLFSPVKKSSCLNQERNTHRLFTSKNSLKQLYTNIPVDFDVRGQHGWTFSLEEALLWIMDLYCGQKRQLKGIVHPKMKILSSFTHPQVVPNLYECLCSAEHKWRYSEECRKQSNSGAPLTSIVFFSYYGSQWCPKTAWLQTFFKISSFVFGRTKKFIQVWNYLRVSKWWQNFHFWVNYPFKVKTS